MNLILAQQLLAAANEQPHGFLRVRGWEFAHEVRLLADAGLAEACAVDELSPSPSAVIKSITNAGQAFLRALNRAPLEQIACYGY